MENGLEAAVAHSNRLAERLNGERGNLVDFVIDLADFDARRRYETLGYAILWDYCVGHLRLSTGQTFYRTNAAYVIQKAPISVEYLRDGRMCMTTIHELVDVISDENSRDLLDRCSGKTRFEVKEIVAGLKPHPDAEKPSGTVRKTAVRQAPFTPPSTNAAPDLFASSTVPAPAPRMEPLAEDRYALPLRFGRDFKGKLDKATVVLGHIVRDGDPLKVIERGLDLILEEEAKRRAPPKKEVVAAKDGKPRPYIPVDLERAVWERDEGMCTWILADGTRCCSQRRVQTDHIIAVAFGGKTELPNLRLLCDAHNRLHERQTFGHAFVDGRIREAREKRHRDRLQKEKPS